MSLHSLSSRPRRTALADPKAMSRSFRHLAYLLGFSPFPFRVHLDITDRCNSRCPTCSKWKGQPKQAELTADEWRPIFRRLRGRVTSGRVTLGGGEPLVRPDIGPIVSDLKENDLHVILITNGIRLDVGLLDDLEARGLDNLMVSLNSLRPEVHDQTRGVPGNHRHLMGVLPRLAERRLKTTVATIVFKRNLEELEGLVEMVRDLGLAGIVFQVLVHETVHSRFDAPVPRTLADDWYQRDPNWIRDTAALKRVVDRLVWLKRHGAPISNPVSQLRWFTTYYGAPHRVPTLPCLAGVTAMNIDPYGRVRLCYGFDPVGDLTREDPIAVWRSPRAKACRAAMKRCRRTCRLQNHNY